MRRKRWSCAALALVLALALGALGVKAQSGRDLHAARAYLAERKCGETGPAALDRVKTDPSGKVTAMEVTGSANLELLIACVEGAEGVRRVEAIPRLSKPRVTCGDRLRGDWKRLYYTDPASGRITEFTLARADSMALALCLVPFGDTYPEIRALYMDELTAYLQARMPEQGEDQFQLSEDGRLESVNIRTQETLEKYLDCVRNCTSIQDQTERLCGIWALPPTVRVAGRDTCNCEYVTYTSPSTGRRIAFTLDPEDSQRFVDYLNALAGAKGS